MNDTNKSGATDTVGLPLAGTRVLDLSRGLGAYCARLLSAFGADLIKIESPAGDRLRSGRSDCQQTAHRLTFDYYYRGARGLSLDLRDERAIPILARLAATVDVIVIEPFGDGVAPGFDPATGELDWAPADAVVCCLTPLGRIGPWTRLRTTPLVSYALSGLMWRLGPPDGPPKAPPGRQLVDQLGGHAAAAILAALRDRPVVGGQLIDLSLHELQSAQDDQIDRYDLTSAFTSRAAPVTMAPPSGVWECADGNVEFMVHNPAHWDGFVQVLGTPTELSDPALRQRDARLARADELTEFIRQRLLKTSVRELVRASQAKGVPSSEQFEPAELVDDVHPHDREFWTEVDLREEPGHRSTARYPGAPFRSTAALFATGGPAPLVGEHDREIYRDELGYGAHTLAIWKEQGLVL